MIKNPLNLIMILTFAWVNTQAQAGYRTIEMPGNQSISGPVRWVDNDYTVHGAVTVKRGGLLEIGTTGSGLTAIIEGKLVIEKGGQVIMGHKSLGTTQHSVCDIHGDVELSGSLTVDNTTVEIVGTFQNEFIYKFTDGTLITKNGSLLGGAKYNDTTYATGFDLSSGKWDCSDTTVQYISGIWVSGSGVLNAQGIKSGDVPDAIHALEGATIRAKDSIYDILFTIDFTKETSQPVVLNLPVNEAIPFWDNSKLPGANYSVKLTNHKIAWTWWLNVIVASKGQAPDAVVVLNNTPSLGMHLMGADLRNASAKDFQLPVSWAGDPAQAEVLGEAPWTGDVPVGHEWDTGNLHWKVGRKPASISCWGVYPTGPDTRLELPGPTKIAELIFSEGTVSIRGTPGKHDAVAGGQFFEVGTREGTESPRANLTIENALLGVFDTNSRSWGGYFKAWNEGRIHIKNSRIGIATMQTNGTGRFEGEADVCAVRLTPSAPTGHSDYQELPEGGPIRIPHTSCPNQ